MKYLCVTLVCFFLVSCVCTANVPPNFYSNAFRATVLQSFSSGGGPSVNKTSTWWVNPTMRAIRWDGPEDPTNVFATYIFNFNNPTKSIFFYGKQCFPGRVLPGEKSPFESSPFANAKFGGYSLWNNQRFVAQWTNVAIDLLGPQPVMATYYHDAFDEAEPVAFSFTTPTGFSASYEFRDYTLYSNTNVFTIPRNCNQ